jgi:methyl-accepting chemotaxis protein
MKLTIGQRILLGLGVVEVLAVGLGIYMLICLYQVHAIGSTIANRDIKILTQLGEVAQKGAETLALRDEVLVGHLLRRANLPGLAPRILENPEKRLDAWRKRHQETDDLLAQIKEQALEDAQYATSPQRGEQWKRIADKVEAVAQARRKLREATEPFFEQLGKEKFDGLPEQIRLMNERHRDFDERLNESIKLTQDQTRIGDELSTRDYRSAWWAVLGGLAFMQVLGLVSGIVIQRSVTGPLRTFMQFVEQVGQGDLTHKAPPSRVGELDQFGRCLDGMVAGLRDLSGQLVSATQNLNAAAAQIMASIQEQASGTREQAAAVQEITATVEEVNQSGNQIADRARQVAAAAEAASSSSTVGLQAMQAVAGSVQEIREQVEAFADHIISLSEKTQAVGDIIAAVNDIAERSNLLALNAAIEAAGAGEHGNRFAVVAGEMKSLADQAKESTLQVQRILVDIQKGISSSVMLTEEAVKRTEAGSEQAETSTQVIHQLADTTQSSVHAFQQIIAATNQQQIGFDQVTQGMKDIRQAAEQSATATAQLEMAVANVTVLSQQLQKAVGRYRL